MPAFRLTISRASLLAALVPCCNVADHKSPTPVRACVLISTDGAKVRVSAWGANEYYGHTVDAIGGEAGTILVNAADLRDRIDALGDGEIRFEGDERAVKIRQGAARKYSLPLFPISEALPPETWEAIGEEAGAVPFVALLTRVSGAMDTDISRPSCGVCLTVRGGRLYAGATNSHVIAEASIPFAGTVDAVISHVAAAQIRKVLSKADGVRISADERALRLTGEGFGYSAQLLRTSHDFPPYTRIVEIAAACRKATITAGREEMLGAIKAVRAAKPDGDRIQLRPSSTGLRLIGDHATNGASEAGVSAECCDVLPEGVNAAYLTAAVEFVAADKVTINIPGAAKRDRAIGGAGEPWLFSDPDGASFVVMPLRYEASDLAPDVEEAAA